jgi:adenosylcobinamide kinase/adenosylcobinamide-phosphate guanylyltransferase
MANLLHDEPDYPEAEKRVTSEINELIASTNKLETSFIIVSNEVVMGIVPETRLGRIYRDLLGRANQLIAEHTNEVYLLMAGMPVEVKGQLK